ncbi:MAG: hypothetical protein ACK4MF_09595 [Hyphomicrobiaceae bacterium]
MRRVENGNGRGFRTAAIAVAMFATLSNAAAIEVPENDYPTVARADYVFACMQVNGQTREALERCSCSIDEIAKLLPYAQYEEAETVMSVIQRGGENVAMLHGPIFQEKIKTLKRAEIEGELRCF